MDFLATLAGATVLIAGTAVAVVWCAAFIWDAARHTREAMYRWSKRLASRRGLNAIRFGVAARVLRPFLDVRADELKAAGADSYAPVNETPEAAQRRHDATIALNELRHLYKTAMNGGPDTSGRTR
jgi:hypothetical protein